MNYISGELDYLLQQKIKLESQGYVCDINHHGFKKGYVGQTNKDDYMEDWYVLSFIFNS